MMIFASVANLLALANASSVGSLQLMIKRDKRCLQCQWVLERTDEPRNKSFLRRSNKFSGTEKGSDLTQAVKQAIVEATKIVPQYWKTPGPPSSPKLEFQHKQGSNTKSVEFALHWFVFDDSDVYNLVSAIESYRLPIVIDLHATPESSEPLLIESHKLEHQASDLSSMQVGSLFSRKSAGASDAVSQAENPLQSTASSW